MNTELSVMKKVIIRRTVLNAIVCLVDFFPQIGAAAPFLADIAKFSRQLDLTPDVPKEVVFGLFTLEIPSIGIFPSYVLVAAYQFYKDLKRLKTLS